MSYLKSEKSPLDMPPPMIESQISCLVQCRFRPPFCARLELPCPACGHGQVSCTIGVSRSLTPRVIQCYSSSVVFRYNVTLPHMAMVEPSSIPWFIAFMRLHCRGLIPTVTPSEFMPGHKELAEFWGPRSPLGFTFSDHGLPGYEIYVRQLFSRVLQLPWPSTGVLPFNFARGLLVEALGVEVNWAEFGYRATHPHQSHSGIPRVLPEYRGLVRPLRALALVMPRAHIPVSISGLSLRIRSCSTYV